MIYVKIFACLLGGFLVGWLARQRLAAHLTQSAETKAKDIISNAKAKQQEIFLKAKESALKIIDKAKREEDARRQELKRAEDRIEKRQIFFEKKILELEKSRKVLSREKDNIEEAKNKIRQIYEKARAELEKISSLTVKEARELLLQDTEKKMKSDILARIKKLEDYGSEEIEKRAKNLITNVIERCAATHTSEITTTSVTLPSDKVKGRIIGREGRNIRVIEQLTGVEIIVDDTPDVVFVSAFNPIRRQLAKLVLDKLILDGRIQPARVERIVQETKKELARDIRKAGEDAVYQEGITGLDPKIVQLLGRLKYRSSYGQNVLQHSIEVADLSVMLAEELGANVSVCRKAGLLHDIGKAVDFETQGTHPEIGKHIGEKYNLPQDVIIPIATHHDDHPPTLEAVIVKVADAISGARPGARKGTYEEYIKRLGELEDIAKKFEGVEKAYAIQSGRELRVFVSPGKIDDLAATKLARKIADQIEEELKYPGEIKVTVIRENRISEYAR